jgi:hypothetical protein
MRSEILYNQASQISRWGCQSIFKYVLKKRLKKLLVLNRFLPRSYLLDMTHGKLIFLFSNSLLITYIFREKYNLASPKCGDTRLMWEQHRSLYPYTRVTLPAFKALVLTYTRFGFPSTRIRTFWTLTPHFFLVLRLIRSYR